MNNPQFHHPSDLPPVRLLFSGEERCSPSHEFGGKRPYLLFHIVLAGRGQFFLQRRGWELTAGDAFIVFPEQTHLYRADGEEPWHYFWLALGSELIPFLESHGISSSAPVLHSERAEELYRLFGQIKKPGHRSEAAGGEFRRYAALFGILADLLESREDRSSFSSRGLGPDHVRTMKSFISEYCETLISVKDVTEYVHLERSYASRLFRKQTGLGIASYIRELRLDRARESLAGGASVKQAAYGSGFRVYENFLKLFKKRFNETPGHYRKRIQKSAAGEIVEEASPSTPS